MMITIYRAVSFPLADELRLRSVILVGLYNLSKAISVGLDHFSRVASSRYHLSGAASSK